MLVEEIMTAEPVVADASSSVGQAMRLLKELDVRHLPVIDDGELVGIVSDRDLKGLDGVELLAAFDGPEGAAAQLARPVTSVMNGDVLSVGPEDDVTEAIDLILEHRVGAIPVVDRRRSKLVGIVSYVDVLRALRDAL